MCKVSWLWRLSYNNEFSPCGYIWIKRSSVVKYTQATLPSSNMPYLTFRCRHQSHLVCELDLAWWILKSVSLQVALTLSYWVSSLQSVVIKWLHSVGMKMNEKIPSINHESESKKKPLSIEDYFACMYCFEMVYIAVIFPFFNCSCKQSGYIMTSTSFRMLCLNHFMQVRARKHTCKTGKSFYLFWVFFFANKWFVTLPTSIHSKQIAYFIKGRQRHGSTLLFSPLCLIWNVFTSQTGSQYRSYCGGHTDVLGFYSA